MNGKLSLQNIIESQDESKLSTNSRLHFPSYNSMSFDKVRRRVVKRRRTKRSHKTSKLKDTAKPKKRKDLQEKEQGIQDFASKEQPDERDETDYYLESEDYIDGSIYGNSSLGHPLDIINPYDILHSEESQPIYYSMIRSSSESRSASNHKGSMINQQQGHLVILQYMLFLFAAAFYCDITQLLPFRVHHYI